MMCTCRQWEMEYALVDPSELGFHVDGYLSKNTDSIFIFSVIVTMDLK